jgi:hypothetical protein
VHPWSGLLHLCEPTCVYCRLLVRAWAQIVLLAPLPHIYIEEGESASLSLIIAPYAHQIYIEEGESASLSLIIAHYAHQSCIRCDQVECTSNILCIRSSFVLGLSLSWSIVKSRVKVSSLGELRLRF